ncbi:hypothetical protein BJX99DRAFT_253266 [Aspergillus californicus]
MDSSPFYELSSSSTTHRRRIHDPLLRKTKSQKNATARSVQALIPAPSQSVREFEHEMEKWIKRGRQVGSAWDPLLRTIHDDTRIEHLALSVVVEREHPKRKATNAGGAFDDTRPRATNARLGSRRV